MREVDPISPIYQPVLPSSVSIASQSTCLPTVRYRVANFACSHTRNSCACRRAGVWGEAEVRPMRVCVQLSARRGGDRSRLAFVAAARSCEREEDGSGDASSGSREMSASAAGERALEPFA